jgi:hypothetical protein
MEMCTFTRDDDWKFDTLVGDECEKAEDSEGSHKSEKKEGWLPSV